MPLILEHRELSRQLIESHRKLNDRSNVHDVVWPEPCVVSVPVCFQPADFSHASTVGRRRANFQKSAVSAYSVKQKFPCPTCPSVFSHKNNLYYHAKFECGQMPRFNCPYCIYRTKHVSNVRAHVRRKHPGNNVYAIDVCKILNGWIIQRMYSPPFLKGKEFLNKTYNLFFFFFFEMYSLDFEVSSKNPSMCIFIYRDIRRVNLGFETSSWMWNNFFFVCVTIGFSFRDI